MKDVPRTWSLIVGAERTSVAWDPPASRPKAVFVCAHGAGGTMNDRSVVAIASALCARGIGVVRFNFLYRENGSSRPDAMPRLLACLRAVVSDVRARLAPEMLLVGGRSMGGRAASVYASEGGACDGLLLLAYPLHPPGQPQKLRDAHLPAIAQPVLCVNGTRDAFCERTLMDTVVSRLGSNWRMHWLEGADHGFHVLKRSGRTDGDVLAEAADQVSSWLGSIERPADGRT